MGEKLKKERELRGVSLDEIAAATRIQKKFLQALEENRFDSLPAPVFITGFLRAYASHLGMDTDSVVSEFEAVRNVASPSVESAPPPDSVEAKNLPMIAGGVVAAVLVIAVAAYLFRPAARQEELPPPVEEELLAPAPEAAPAAPSPVAETSHGQQVAAPAEELMKSAVSAEAQRSYRVKPELEKPKEPVVAKSPVPAAVAQVKPKEETKPAKPAASATPAEKQSAPYLLGLSAMAEDVWVYVVVDGGEVRDMYIRSQQTVYIKGGKSFMLTTGNARALRLKMNGKYVPIPGADSNKVIRNWPVPLVE
ncbi:MAG: DUF4115 domain-containing protein [Nitrospinae bacterium]|nr:DUF4115 domain-containing protein [Nitrospinota bacterium]